MGAIAEFEKNLIVERVRARMRRARLEGRQIGRAPLKIDREQVVHDRRSGMSLTEVTESAFATWGPRTLTFEPAAAESTSPTSGSGNRCETYRPSQAPN